MLTIGNTDTLMRQDPYDANELSYDTESKNVDNNNCVSWLKK